MKFALLSQHIMGCTESKVTCLPEWELAVDAKQCASTDNAWLQQYPSTYNPTPWRVPGKDQDSKPPAAAYGAKQQLLQQQTTIQVIWESRTGLHCRRAAWQMNLVQACRCLQGSCNCMAGSSRLYVPLCTTCSVLLYILNRTPRQCALQLGPSRSRHTSRCIHHVYIYHHLLLAGPATPPASQHPVKAGQLGGTFPLHPPGVQILAPAGPHSHPTQPALCF